MVLKRCLYFLFVLLGLSSAVSAVNFVDLPAGHWSKASVDRAVESGILSGFEDDTYRGKDTVNRFELAVFTGNVLRYMEGNFASQEEYAAFEKQFESFVQLYEEDRNSYYRVSKEEWMRTLRDIEFLRAEVTELRKQVAAPNAAKL